MTEKRKSARQKSFLRGIVCPADCNSTIDCLVRDISETGARLKFTSPQSIAENLDLHIPVKGQTFRAKVRWSNVDEIGVSFETNAAVDTSPQSDGELSGRVARLEAEIVALKQLIKRLQKDIGNKTEVA
jgi:uncharacterized protein YceH (UPF0502 family)